MRIILYTGKGGVGKTSIAAATAAHMASHGKKVLIMSTDQAHSLQDSFCMELENEPKMVTDNLYAMEIDSIKENEKLWGVLKKYIEDVFFLKAERNLANEELLVFPGFEELLALLKIKEIEAAGEYDVLVVDCAPTGETLSLLKFPEMFKWWITKILPAKRKAVKVVRPIAKKLIKIPIPEDSVFDEFEEIFNRLDELHKLLLDHRKTSMRVVMTPERIVIKEAQRNFSCIHLFDFNVDSIFVNKILPGKSMTGYFGAWKGIQEKNMQYIKESFEQVPVFHAPLLEHELIGIENLKYMGREIYKNTDPAEVLWDEKIFTFEKDDDRYFMKIHLPCIDKEDLEMFQRGDEVSISIKNEKRNFVLPKKLESRQIQGADYSDGYLIIQFA